MNWLLSKLASGLKFAYLILFQRSEFSWSMERIIKGALAFTRGGRQDFLKHIKTNYKVSSHLLNKFWFYIQIFSHLVFFFLVWTPEYTHQKYWVLIQVNCTWFETLEILYRKMAQERQAQYWAHLSWVASADRSKILSFVVIQIAR